MELHDKNTSSIINKETIQRLLKDVRQIIKHPLEDNGIYYKHDTENMLSGYAMIIGPEDTPYFGGYYFFKFDYPLDYPYSPPKVTYYTNDGATRFNPNLYKCGKVCVSVLNTWAGEKWSSCQTISSILLVLCSLLNKEPFLNEPGQQKDSKDFLQYTRSIEFQNINYAVCEIINCCKKKALYSNFIEFSEIIYEKFLENYDKLYNFVLGKSIEPEEIVKVHLYLMRTKINYAELLTKLETTKLLFEKN
jgi:ubiquitin-protein ligase